MLGEGSLQLCSYLDREMPSKAKREKERKWKLARNAVWGCVPARLGSELPATWVPATELVPGRFSSPNRENIPQNHPKQGVKT